MNYGKITEQELSEELLKKIEEGKTTNIEIKEEDLSKELLDKINNSSSKDQVVFIKKGEEIKPEERQEGVLYLVEMDEEEVETEEVETEETIKKEPGDEIFEMKLTPEKEG